MAISRAQSLPAWSACSRVLCATLWIQFPGADTIQSDFARRGMRFSHDAELTTPSYYRVRMNAIERGSILAAQSVSA
jgi:hypothetical protein